MISARKNQQGFGAIEIFLITLVLIVIVAVAGYALRKKTSTPPVTTTKTATSSSSTNSTSSSGAWRDTNILSAITSAGQTVVSHKQVTVSADVDWVDTSLQISSGQHLWITTNSADKWTGNPQYFPYSDANGLSSYPGGYRIDANANVESLIGFVGSTPTEVAEQDISVGASAGGPGGVTAPGLFEVGNTLTNFTPSVTGEVWLRNNDNTNLDSDVGQQVAEVWVTS